MMNNRLVRVCLAGAASIAFGASAKATVIINDFGAGDAYSATGGVTVSLFQNVGVRFVPAGPVSPTDITVAMKAASAVTVTLSVCVDASNHPGAALASTTLSLAAGDPQVLHATFATPAALTAGTTYWIKAVPTGGTATWMPNSIGQTGYSFTLASGAWNVTANGVTPALRLEDNTAPAVGACCTGSTCATSTAAACAGGDMRYGGDGTVCNVPGNATTPCCKADFNQSGSVSVQDIFDFLSAYFAGDATADVNGGGVSVQDIFDFLAEYFAGCP